MAPADEHGHEDQSETDPHRSDRPHMGHLREELSEFEAAAIATELETGEREETVEEAKRHLLLRLVRIIAGTIVTLVGIALLVLPGPGFLVIAAGLALLAQDVPFARRLLQRVRNRLPEDADGGVSTTFIVACSAGGVVFMGVSVWWTFLR